MKPSVSAGVYKAGEVPTVKRLLKYIPPVYASAPCLDVLELFQENPGLFAVPVVDAGQMPCGILDRYFFIDIFIKPYAREIYGKRPISEFMLTTPIVVDRSTSIDDIAHIIIDAGMQHMVSGFIATEHGRYLGIANGHDLLNEITQRKQAHLYHLAHFDQLTQLPNRVHFLDRLERSIVDAARQARQVGLLFIDLDNFKHYNDSMGHGFGDKLLCGAADAMSACVRECDTVARLAGDEFTIILGDVGSRRDLEVMCDRLLDKLRQPLMVMGREVFVTASIGTARYPDDDDQAAGLLVKADAAMYEAKRSGRNTYRHYMPGMNVYSLERMTLENDLRMALERDEFELYYQPQITLDSGKVIGNEALIRWRHPVRGLLTPIHFIDIAEETGLIVPIGKWVLQEACRQHRIWAENGLPPLCISINISAMQFYQADFCEMLYAILAESGVPPHSLELELTESLFMLNVDTVLSTLRDLHAHGVRLAIDDFGTGYSNLAYLKRFPIDRLKIDQSFIRNIESEPVNAEIVRAIVALGNSMSMQLVAEGVENDDELAMATSSGCQYVQGYHFSKPLPAAKFEDWARAHC